MSEKIELLGLSKEELAAEIEKLGEKPFRAKQLWQWIYNRGVGDFAEMSNLSKDFAKSYLPDMPLPVPKSLPSRSRLIRRISGCWSSLTASG